MPNRHKSRRTKAEQRLITAAPEKSDVGDILPFPDERTATRRKGNHLPSLDPFDVEEIERTIWERYTSAKDATEDANREIEQSERQFKGLFKDQKENDIKDENDSRVFLKKTMEHAQSIYSHLDSLTNQLHPLLTVLPKPKSLFNSDLAFKRAKLKEILTNDVLENNRFTEEVLPRWRWNFLKHPSAYLQVLYQNDPVNPDIRIEVVDRGVLTFDPYITTGNIRDASWVIRQAWVTREEAQERIDDGDWHLQEQLGTIDGLFSGAGSSKAMLRILGVDVGSPPSSSTDRDQLIEVWHYWQAPINGQPDVYAVTLGGGEGRLVRWGPNPFPYKGIPFRGKAYIRDAYKPDGISLVNQFRPIQEVYNTFYNLRVEDVLQGTKNQMLMFENLFNEKTSDDFDAQSRFIRVSQDFMEKMEEQGKKLSDFVMPIGSADSTQHLLKDMGFLLEEGNQETGSSDVFRGQNPQPGATLGQVQEQLVRALGIFRPVFSQEMSLIEEVGEIINIYLSDENYFGEERIVAVVGDNRYEDVIELESMDGTSGFGVRSVSYDEMDVDTTVSVMDQAEHLASKTIRANAQASFFESSRHHPELIREASKVINFPKMMIQGLRDSGVDVEAFQFTDEQIELKKKEDDQKRIEKIKEAQQALQAQMQIETQGKVANEQAKTKGKLAEIQAKNTLEKQSDIELLLVKISEENKADRAILRQEFLNDMRKMLLESKLERQAPDASGVGHGNNINQ